ncbi:DNA-binding protein snt1 [Savitreella phatthalungensis]
MFVTESPPAPSSPALSEASTVKCAHNLDSSPGRVVENSYDRDASTMALSQRHLPDADRSATPASEAGITSLERPQNVFQEISSPERSPSIQDLDDVLLYEAAETVESSQALKNRVCSYLCSPEGRQAHHRGRDVQQLGSLRRLICESNIRSSRTSHIQFHWAAWRSNTSTSVQDKQLIERVLGTLQDQRKRLSGARRQAEQLWHTARTEFASDLLSIPTSRLAGQAQDALIEEVTTSSTTRGSRRTQQGYDLRDAILSAAPDAYLTNLASIPPMSSDPMERLSLAFEERSAIETRPLEFYGVSELASSADWCDQEQRIFFKLYKATPKNFAKIVAGLPGRTSEDCVAHYYLTKKLIDYRRDGRLRGKSSGRGKVKAASRKAVLLADRQIARSSPRLEAAAQAAETATIGRLNSASDRSPSPARPTSSPKSRASAQTEASIGSRRKARDDITYDSSAKQRLQSGHLEPPQSISMTPQPVNVNSVRTVKPHASSEKAQQRLPAPAKRGPEDIIEDKSRANQSIVPNDRTREHQSSTALSRSDRRSQHQLSSRHESLSRPQNMKGGVSLMMGNKSSKSSDAPLLNLPAGPAAQMGGRSATGFAYSATPDRDFYRYGTPGMPYPVHAPVLPNQRQPWHDERDRYRPVPNIQQPNHPSINTNIPLSTNIRSSTNISCHPGLHIQRSKKTLPWGVCKPGTLLRDLDLDLHSTTRHSRISKDIEVPIYLSHTNQAHWLCVTTSTLVDMMRSRARTLEQVSALC